MEKERSCRELFEKRVSEGVSGLDFLRVVGGFLGVFLQDFVILGN